MLFFSKQLNSIGKTNLDAAVRFASASSELAERLIKAHVNAASRLLDGHNEQLQTLLSKPGNAAPATYWQRIYQSNTEKAQEILRYYFEEVSEIQAETARLMTEQVTAMNKDAVRNFGDLARAATEETEKAVKATENSAGRKRAP